MQLQKSNWYNKSAQAETQQIHHCWKMIYSFVNLKRKIIWISIIAIWIEEEVSGWLPTTDRSTHLLYIQLCHCHGLQAYFQRHPLYICVTNILMYPLCKALNLISIQFNMFICNVQLVRATINHGPSKALKLTEEIGKMFLKTTLLLNKWLFLANP